MVYHDLEIARRDKHARQGGFAVPHYRE
jgi:hypothetical protein